jgi:hypothetical protein
MDAERSLFRLGQVKGYRNLSQGSVGSAWLLAREILSVTPVVSDQRIVYVGREIPGNKWGIVSIGSDIRKRELPFEGTPTSAFIGFGYSISEMIAVEQDHRDWWIITPGEHKKLNPLFDSRVVGIIQDPENYIKPCLLVLESNNRTLALRSATTHLEVHTASASIEYVTVSHATPYIAYSTVEGEVVVYSLMHKEVVCRFLPEGQG